MVREKEMTRTAGNRSGLVVAGRKATAKRFRSAPTRATYRHGVSPCRCMPKRRSQRQLRRHEAGWKAAGGELSVCRMTNSIRRDVLASPLR